MFQTTNQIGYLPESVISGVAQPCKKQNDKYQPFADTLQ